MSLNWRWEDKMGTCVVDGYKNGELTEVECILYDCNGLFVSLFEYKENGEDYYNMADFAADESHSKNCLGLTKGYEDSDKNYVHEYRLNMNFKNAQKMAKCLMQAQAKGKWNGRLITYKGE